MYTQSLDIPGNVAPLESGATSPEQAHRVMVTAGHRGNADSVAALLSSLSIAP